MRSRLTLGVFLAGLSLASSSVSAQVWQPIPPKVDLDYLVDSVHRIGTHVYLVERGTSYAPQGSIKYEAPLEFDCAGHALRMAWADLSSAGRPAQRAYGKSVGHYAASQWVPAGTTAYGEAILQWACRLPNQPERLVNIDRSSDDKLIQIDSHSLSRTGAGTSFWTRYDYPQFQFDPPYDAPYDSKREFVTVNCQTNRFRISVGYDFTPDGAVTDNMIARDDTEMPIDPADDYEAAIKAVACGKPVDPDTYSGIGGETLRAKAPLADDPDIDGVPVPATVVTSAQKFYSILPARPSFKSARIVETMKSTKLATRQTEITIRPSTDGVVRVREIYSPDFFVDRDMLGLVQLKSKMNSQRSETRSVHVTQALTVKGDAWKEGAEVSFVTEGRNVPGPDKTQKWGMTCEIGRSVDATVVNGGLTGQAWPLDCKRLNGDSVKGYYVEALGDFVTTREESKDFGDSDTTIDSVSIER